MNISIVEKSTGNGLDASALKLIAIFGMTLDHVGIVFGGMLPLWAETALFALGGLTFPIMAYLLVEGYKHTSNLKKYAFRLFIFALISSLPFRWALRLPGLNVLFTLLLGLATLYLYDHMKNRPAFWAAFAGMSVFSVVMDWGLIGVPMVLLYRVLRGKRQRVVIPALLPIGLALVQFGVRCIMPSMSGIDDLPSVAYAVIGCGLTIPLLANYNQQRGKSLKYLFYVYYPAHLLVLALLRGLLFHDWAVS